VTDWLLPAACALGLVLIFWGARHGATCAGGCWIGCPDREG
jgi:hypothetical protein